MKKSLSILLMLALSSNAFAAIDTQQLVKVQNYTNQKCRTSGDI